MASVACVAIKANHQILSIWLKRPTRSEIKRIERELDTLLNLILKGGAADKINTKMVQLESRRTRTALVNAEEPPPMLHAEMATFYREQVSALHEALKADNEATRPKAEARVLS